MAAAMDASRALGLGSLPVRDCPSASAFASFGENLASRAFQTPCICRLEPARPPPGNSLSECQRISASKSGCCGRRFQYRWQAIAADRLLAERGVAVRETAPMERPNESKRFENTIERWLHEGVVEIVRRLKDAPFLHLVVDNGKMGQKGLWKPVSEELFVDPTAWTSVRDAVLESSPEAVVLVHRLDSSDGEKRYGLEYKGLCLDSREAVEDVEPATDFWGLVIQERRSKRHACYILKTTKIASVAGNCTSFSLMKAKCFGPALHKQLESSWLA